MLIVIAIIAVLAGLLLPVLSRAKDRAKAAQCLSNVKQWALALWLYSDEAEEFFPYEGQPGAVHSGFNLNAWFNVCAPYAGQLALQELYLNADPPLPGQRSLYTCPSVARVTNAVSAANPYFMYGFNNRLDPDGPEQFRRSVVRRPDQTVVFTENNESRYPSASGRFTPARHRGRANLAFADGHVEAVRRADFVRGMAEDTVPGDRTAASRAEWSVARAIYWYPFAGAPE